MPKGKTKAVEKKSKKPKIAKKKAIMEEIKAESSSSSDLEIDIKPQETKKASKNNKTKEENSVFPIFQYPLIPLLEQFKLRLRFRHPSSSKTQTKSPRAKIKKQEKEG
jgi:hypothetical protein